MNGGGSATTSDVGNSSPVGKVTQHRQAAQRRSQGMRSGTYALQLG